jgi:hypothetical protein
MVEEKIAFSQQLEMGLIADGHNLGVAKEIRPCRPSVLAA